MMHSNDIFRSVDSIFLQLESFFPFLLCWFGSQLVSSINTLLTYLQVNSSLLFTSTDTIAKYERICLFASRILEKHICIFEYNIFLKSVFVVFYEIVFYEIVFYEIVFYEIIF